MPPRSERWTTRVPRGGTLLGIACMVAAGLFVVGQDAVAKVLVGRYPIGQVICLRSAVALLIIVLVVLRAGGVRRLATSVPRLHAWRALIIVMSTTLYVTGLRYVPLASAILVVFTAPLFATALAVPMLGETVGWRRWLAVLIGFAGVGVMVRPAGDAVSLALLLPLGAALLAAIQDIVTRRMTTIDSPATILFYSTLALVAAGLATWPAGWEPVPPGDAGLFVLSGVTLACAHTLMIQAFRHAEVVVASPFRYTNLLWATLFGFLLWGDVPGIRTLVGGVLLIGSGLYILRREIVVRRLRARPTDGR